MSQLLISLLTDSSCVCRPDHFCRNQKQDKDKPLFGSLILSLFRSLLNLHISIASGSSFHPKHTRQLRQKLHSDRFCHSFSPKFYSKTQWKLTQTESWVSWRRMYRKCHVNCEGIWVMPVWMSKSAIMHCDRLLLSFSPKFYSKTQWKLTQTESWSSWRRMYRKCHVNCEGIWVMPVWMSKSAIMYCDRLPFIFSQILQ